MSEKAGKVITLCGSSKFKEDFDRVNEELTMKGNVVFSLGVFGHAKGIEHSKETVEQLKKIHFKKIDLSDKIYVVNKDGYIGESTRIEINYAETNGKEVEYMEFSDNLTMLNIYPANGFWSGWRTSCRRCDLYEETVNRPIFKFCPNCGRKVIRIDKKV